MRCTYKCGFIASPNYPAKYPDSTTVTWNIHITDDYYIRLEFLDFQVESMLADCGQDYVDVFNTFRDGSKEVIGRYCLETQPPTYLFSSLNQMAITFKSDGQHSNFGFLAQYSAEQYKPPDYIRKQIDISGKDMVSMYSWYCIDNLFHT